jgi:hypothetical protein
MNISELPSRTTRRTISFVVILVAMSVRIYILYWLWQFSNEFAHKWRGHIK